MEPNIDMKGHIIAAKGNLWQARSAKTNSLDISKAARGIYFVRVVDEQGKVYVVRF